MFIKRIFKKLTEALKRPSHPYKINTELFAQIDLNTISEELDLERMGKANGEKNFPDSQSERVAQVKKIKAIKVPGTFPNAVRDPLRERLIIFLDPW